MSISAQQTESACAESGLTKKPIASWLSMTIASYTIFGGRVFGDKVPALRQA